MTRERTEYNNCTVEVYDRSSTTRIVDSSGDLARCSIVNFDSFYPGGLWGSAEIRVPRDPTRSWLFKQGHRLVIRNGLAVAFEGEIVNPGYYAGRDTGRTLTAVGYWGAILKRRGLNKPWCDTRLTEDVWPYQSASIAAGAELCTLDRNSRIRFTPKEVGWGTQSARVRYTAPTGQTVKRVTCTYDLQEGGQAWALDIFNPTTASSITGLITTSGSGTFDETLAAANQTIDLRFVSQATQTASSSGTIYAQFSNIKVYTESVSINPTEIVKDWIGAISTLNSDTTQVDSNTTTLEPWITDGYEMAADNLARLAGIGSTGPIAAWAAYILPSEDATTPDGKPVLAFKQQPALTDYDYAVRLDDQNVSGELRLAKTDVYNWIVVSYVDALGVTRYLTPDDDANLKDTTSITDWGQREFVLNNRFASSGAATQAGQRFLAQRKDEHVYVSGPLNVTGYIRGKQGQPVPASLIRAGKRVRIENFLTDEVGVSGAGITAIISSARYDDASETCQISFGVSDLLAVILARIAHFETTGIFI